MEGGNADRHQSTTFDTRLDESSLADDSFGGGGLRTVSFSSENFRLRFHLDSDANTMVTRDNAPLILDDSLLATESSTDEIVCESSSDHCHQKPPGNVSNKKAKARNQLIIACVLCSCFMVAEIIGGYFANSLAIMTDAAHLMSDVASMVISLVALWVATRPATYRMSFGFYRAEVLGAVVSVLIIWVLTGVLVYLAVQRCLSQDYQIDADVMLITAACGVAINLILGVVLHQTGHGHSHGGGGHSHSTGQGTPQTNGTIAGHGMSGHRSNQGHGDADNAQLNIQINSGSRVTTPGCGGGPKGRDEKDVNINVRAAFIHVIGDLIQSVGVLIAAYIIKYKPEYKLADPICTFVFSILVLFTTVSILKDALNVLMEGTPRNINYRQLKSDLESIREVKSAHSLHVWSLTLDTPALAVHLAIAEGMEADQVLMAASRLVQSKYNIYHSTIQVERYQENVMRACSACRGPSR